MRKIVVFRSKKFFSMIILTAILLFCCSFNAKAATNAQSIFLGSGNVDYDFAASTVNYDVNGYVYINSNTTEALDISSMVQWIFNYGIYSVNEVRFEAHDGEWENYQQAFGYIDDVGTGDNARIEADWESICSAEGKSNVYEKIGSPDKFAYTNMVSGYSQAGLGGWASFWFENTREDDFHY